MQTYSQIVGLTLDDLKNEIKKAEHEILAVRMGIQVGQEKDNSKQGKLRKHIARLKTAYNRKKSEDSVTTPAS